MPAPPYDPQRDGPYGLWLRDKNTQTNRGATAIVQREKRVAGRIVRNVTEATDAGALITTRNRTDERGREHQDVHIRAPLITNNAVIPQVTG